MTRNMILVAGLISTTTLWGCGDAAGHGALEGQEAPAASQEKTEEAPPVTRTTAVDALDEFIASKEIDKTRAGWKERMPRPPQAEFNPSDEYFWDLTTNKGDIVVKFMPDIAPMHVSSTIYLTRAGFYDDLTFHRVITQFMAQGGCPQGSGRGGPGYKYAGEFDPAVKHDRPGLLSMANAGAGTDGSQFFLTFVPTPWLDGKHTIFGEVVEGMDVLKKLEAAGSPSGKTSEPLSLEKAAIRVEVGAD